MNSVLIWNSFPLKERNGGPPTYLFNLSRGLNSIENNNQVKVAFLSDILSEKSESLENRKVINTFKNFCPRILSDNLRILNYLLILKKSKQELTINQINKFQAIHFHKSIDIYKNRNILNDFKGKVFLTSHSPKPAWIETIEDIYNLSLNETFPTFRRMLEDMDIWGFKRADVLIFPCAEAIEPYLNWNKYKSEIHILSKYKFLQTGIPKANFKRDKVSVRKQLNIPENAIVFSFIGRHSIIKGYDLLLELGKSVLIKHPNVFFIIAGTEEPLKGLNHTNWIEVGWTDDPHSFVNASDVFILPNRQTYFDLVLLEILSMGKPIILSETGGNKHFKKYLNSGLFFFENNNLVSLENVVSKSIDCSNNHNAFGELNRSIFVENYSLNAFTNSYLELYKSLID